jgi:hypothetical protein
MQRFDKDKVKNQHKTQIDNIASTTMEKGRFKKTKPMQK